MTQPKPPADPQIAARDTLDVREKNELANNAEEMRNGGSLFVSFGAFGWNLRRLQLPLQRIPDGFDLRFKGHEILQDRNTYILEAKPRVEQKVPTGEAEDASNFLIKIWIDESEAEIVKIEERAIHPGLISRSRTVAVNPVNPRPENEAKSPKSLPERTLMYGKGTLVTMAWRKINGEAWLPENVRFSGTEIDSFPVRLGEDVKFFSNNLPLEYEIEFSDYKKFDVKTRILPPH